MSARSSGQWSCLLSLVLCCVSACALDEQSSRSGGAEQDSIAAVEDDEDILLVGDPDERQMSIVKGQEDPGHPQVGLVLMWSDAGYQNNVGVCTGTLVGRRTVLTAAHCINDNVYYTVNFLGVPYVVTGVIPHPQGPKGKSFILAEETVYDLAVLILRDAPSVSPSSIGAQAPQPRELLHVVGYGVTASGRQDARIKRSATTMVAERRDGFFIYGEPIVAMGTTCQGDSGGPLFLRGRGRDVQVGVTSAGDCKSWGHSTRLDRHIDRLRQVSEGDLLVTNVSTFPTTASMGFDVFRPLGAGCKQDFDCQSLSCAHDGYGSAYCSQGCSEHLPCPDWFECRPSPGFASLGFCWPTAP